MRLKTRRKSEERDPNVCSTSRCNLTSTVIDATHKRDDCEVYYCDRHWVQLCDEEDAELKAARKVKHAKADKVARARLAKAMRLKPGQSLQPGRYAMQHTDEGLEVIT